MIDVFWYTGRQQSLHDGRKTVAPRLEQKTVKDAVEFYNGVWPSSERKIDKIKFDMKRHEFFADFGEPCSERFYIVCTREQFEDYVAAKSWTHTYLGYECKIVHKDGKSAWIVTKNGQNRVISVDLLKPIKPTITKDEADKVLDFAESIGQLQVAEQWIANTYAAGN